MIKTLGLALYGPLAASTRYRLGQFVPALASHGIDLRIHSLLGDAYLQKRFSGRGPALGAILRDYAHRVQLLLKTQDFDAAIVHLELLPFVPSIVERALLRIPYVYDMDDAFYLRYELGAKRLLKPLLGRKFDSVIGSAAAVTAGNRILASYARQFNNSVVEIPTVVDVGRYHPNRGAKGSRFTIGWIGSPSTATYLPSLVPILSALAKESPLDFVVIGGKAPAVSGANVIERPWSEQTEVDLINKFDVGVMPLPDDEWARGKCAFKLIQYMACAVPVVASGVGANTDVVTPDCGFLANTPEEWVSSLRKLRDNASLRERMGVAARARVVESFSLEAAVPKLAETIRSVAQARTSCK
jgi:glycosyltransferase involved in cell wall biosynthesis